MAEHVKFKEGVEVEGEAFDVYVSGYRGAFVAVAAGEDPHGAGTVVAENLGYEKLLGELKVKAKQAATRVEVPFAALREGKVVWAVARGLHASNGKVLVTWQDGTKEQIERHKCWEFMERPEPAAAAKIEELARAVLASREALTAAEKALERAVKPLLMANRRGLLASERGTPLHERVMAAIAATVTAQRGVAKEEPDTTDAPVPFVRR